MYDHLALSESGFLLDTRSGVTYSCSRTGTFLLRRLIEGAPPAQLATLLADAFDVADDSACHDVDEFLFRLRDVLDLDVATGTVGAEVSR